MFGTIKDIPARAIFKRPPPVESIINEYNEWSEYIAIRTPATVEEIGSKLYAVCDVAGIPKEDVVNVLLKNGGDCILLHREIVEKGHMR